MSNKDFLIWLAERFVKNYGESESDNHIIRLIALAGHIEQLESSQKQIHDKINELYQHIKR